MLFMFNHYLLRMSDNFSLAPDLDRLATVSFDIRKLKQNFEKTKPRNLSTNFERRIYDCPNVRNHKKQAQKLVQVDALEILCNTL